MIERALVYVHAVSPARRFVGCGALVEGGYVVTCRHVWAAATSSSADEVKCVEIEYPFSRAEGRAARASAQLEDSCEEGDGEPADVVILKPADFPIDLPILNVARHEKFEVGPGYIHGGLVGRDRAHPERMRDVRIDGRINDWVAADGRRQFSGENLATYWSNRGSSGSPVFREGGEQLAGILSLSETGGNEGSGAPHEAFVVPGTTIRRFLGRVIARPEAARQGIEPEGILPLLDQVSPQDVTLAELPGRLAQFLEGTEELAAQPVERTNDGSEIDAAIRASRDRIRDRDATGALAVLQAQIDEEERTRARRLLPLLRERVKIERIAFDHKAAKLTWLEIARLDADDIWAWIELGDLHVTTGSLPAAAEAYRRAEATSRLLGEERDLSVSHNKLGDVAVAQGDLPGALVAYRAGLAIRGRLAASDPGNAEWQRDLSVSHDRLGDLAAAQGDLSRALAAYRAGLAIRERLAASDPGNAQWQRDLSVSHDRLGDVAAAQGDLPQALAAYRAGLAIAERLATSDPGNAEWQRDLSVSHNKLGDVAAAQGDLPGALAAYRAGLAIAERLATSDPGNAQWQRDLSVSHNKLGDVAAAQGDLPGALAAYRAGLAIAERLATSDPGNAEWQRDLIVSCVKIADAAPDEAQAPLSRALEIAQHLEQTGRLAPRDAWMPSEFRRRLDSVP